MYLRYIHLQMYLRNTNLPMYRKYIFQMYLKYLHLQMYLKDIIFKCFLKYLHLQMNLKDIHLQMYLRIYIFAAVDMPLISLVNPVSVTSILPTVYLQPRYGFLGYLSIVGSLLNIWRKGRSIKPLGLQSGFNIW